MNLSLVAAPHVYIEAESQPSVRKAKVIMDIDTLWSVKAYDLADNLATSPSSRTPRVH